MNAKQALRISRIHIPIHSSQVTEELIITEEKSHYIRNVLRLKKQHPLIFFTLDGIEYKSVILDIQRHSVTLNKIMQNINALQQSSINTTVIQGISSGDRMDYTVQKAAEMGARSMIPIFSDHCSQRIPKNKYEKKQSHWQAVANSACEQSGRCDLLKIEPISHLQSVIPNHLNHGIYLEPTAHTKINALPAIFHKQLSIFIGPEGGFSEGEIKMFKNNDLLGVQLGQRILRTETAAPVILAAIHALYGDFK